MCYDGLLNIHWMNKTLSSYPLQRLTPRRSSWLLNKYLFVQDLFIEHFTGEALCKTLGICWWRRKRIKIPFSFPLCCEIFRKTLCLPSVSWRTLISAAFQGVNIVQALIFVFKMPGLPFFQCQMHHYIFNTWWSLLSWNNLQLTKIFRQHSFVES